MKHLPCVLATAAVGVFLLLSAPLQAQEWTRFRGPNGTGISTAKGIPVSWTEEEINWRTRLPGVGHASPVIWGDRVFLLSAENDTAQRIVLCLDADSGRILWEQRYASSVHTKHARNSFASATPAVDEQRVYVCWSCPERYTLLALTHDGEPVWERDLGPYVSQHSCGTSPIVYEDLVILANDQDGADREHPEVQGTSFLIAVDRRTGETRWQTPRRSEQVAYSTPCVYQPPDGPPQLIFNSGAHGITSIDPATGHVNWEIDVLDKRSVSSPIIAGGLIFGSTGSGGGGNYVAAVRPGSSDGRLAPQLVYRIDNQAPYVPTAIAVGELLFLWSDGGIVTCLHAATGKTLWRQRVGGSFSGSPICVDGKLYAIDDDGTVVVLAAAEEYKLLGRTNLGEESRSTPAVAGGRMYLRTYSHLISVGGPKDKELPPAGS
jgi:outer membrane protein assembly factor BamB